MNNISNQDSVNYINTITPQPRAVEISNTGATETTLTCGLRGYSVVNYGRYADWYVDNYYEGTTYISENSSNWGTITFRNLNPGTTYKITARLYKSSNNAEISPPSPINRYLTTAESNTKPSSWYWSQSELDAFNGHGTVTTLSYQRWNSFIEKIKEFDIWKNGSNSGNYWLDEAKMTSSDKVLTAYRFNTARNAIGSMASSGSGISPVSTGDTVYGWYFIRLSERLNSIR